MLKSRKNLKLELGTKSNTTVPKSDINYYDQFTLITGMPITMTIAGAYTTVVLRHNTGGNVKKIDNDTYVLDHNHNLRRYVDNHGNTGYFDNHTGEIAHKHHYHHHSHNKSQVNYRSMARRDKQLRDLIHTNFNGTYNEIMNSITYGNDYDDSYIKHDIHNYMRKIRRNTGIKASELVYIVVYEPHMNGRMHCHLLLKFLNRTKSDMKAIRAYLEKSWKQGNSKLSDINRPDYLAKNYFKVCKLGSEKNERLGKMRAGTRTFEHSQSCEKPLVKKTTYNREVHKYIGERLYYRAWRRTTTNSDGYVYGYNNYVGYYYNKERNDNIKRITAFNQIAYGNYDTRIINRYKLNNGKRNKNIRELETRNELESKAYRISKI